MEVDVKKLEDEIKKDFIDKKTRVIKQGAHDYVDEFGDYHRELISSMPWIGSYITKGITHDGTMQMVKCVTQTLKPKDGFVPGKVMVDQLESYTGGTAT